MLKSKSIKVKVFLGNKKQLSHNILANVSVTIADTICVNNISIIKNTKKKAKQKVFISYPSYLYNDEYKNYVFPVSKEAREMLTDVILEEYKKALNEHQDDDDDDDDDEDQDYDDLPF